jgi:iron-sulfur cluster repair protein YtfE (RIC family)
VIYQEEDDRVPECCGEVMTRSAADFIWELDEQGLRKIPLKAQELLRTMQTEHRQLIKELMLERDRWNAIHAPCAVDYAEMHTRLGLLRDHLAVHFTGEEREGFLREALTVAPQLRQRATQLREEHRGFLEALDRLMANLRFDEPETWKESRSDFGRLVLDLRRHEGSENALVQNAFGAELGLGN